MATPHESQSAEVVSTESFRTISRVLTDHESGVLATGALEAYREHKRLMQALKDAVEERMLGDGRMASAQRRTDIELDYFSQRTAAGYARFPKKGEASPQYRHIFDDRTVAKLLPSDADERLEELDQLLKRINDTARAGALAVTLLEALPAAIEAERVAVAAAKELQRAEQAARRDEENARRGLVAAVRSMVKDVQSLFSDSPATARQVLGHRNPTTTRRRNARLIAAAQRAAAEPTTPVPPGPVVRGPLTPPDGPTFNGSAGVVQVGSASPPTVQLNGSAPAPALPAAEEREEG